MSGKRYGIEISGTDYLEDQLTGECYWSDWHEVVETRWFTTKDDAVQFARSITAEQVIAYEKEARTNALGIDVLELVDVRGDCEYWKIVGCVDWIGNNRVYERVYESLEG